MFQNRVSDTASNTTGQNYEIESIPGDSLQNTSIYTSFLNFNVWYWKCHLNHVLWLDETKPFDHEQHLHVWWKKEDCIHGKHTIPRCKICWWTIHALFWGWWLRDFCEVWLWVPLNTTIYLIQTRKRKWETNPVSELELVAWIKVNSPFKHTTWWHCNNVLARNLQYSTAITYQSLWPLYIRVVYLRVCVFKGCVFKNHKGIIIFIIIIIYSLQS